MRVLVEGVWYGDPERCSADREINLYDSKISVRIQKSVSQDAGLLSVAGVTVELSPAEMTTIGKQLMQVAQEYSKGGIK